MHGERIRHRRPLRVKSTLLLRIPAALKSAWGCRSEHPIESDHTLCRPGTNQSWIEDNGTKPGLAEVSRWAHKAAEIRTGGAVL
jgi:hypothetical protein